LKYYIIAGEASGDLHGSNLIKELQLLDVQMDVRAWGGDLMQQQGAYIVKHYRDLAFMGFVEVLTNISTIIKNIKLCKEDIQAYKPDVIVLVDYPGFNLRIATWAKQQGYKIVYYISPQVWAWKESRVKKIKQCVDTMICILPFEKAFYQQWNYEVFYVGHPLIQVIEDYTLANQTISPLSTKPIVALLPGSRKQEIQTKLPIMLSVAQRFPNYDFVVAKAPGLDDSFYEPFLKDYSNVLVVKQKTYSVLMQAKAALVTSGTATLETALFKVPEVVCYIGSNISYQIAKRLIKIKFISLVNLIVDKEIVKELIQHELTVNNASNELDKLLHNQQHITQLQKEYDNLYSILKQGGNASANAANIIYETYKAFKTL
jgi:lipid-A-disaccharide synthase